MSQEQNFSLLHSERGLCDYKHTESHTKYKRIHIHTGIYKCIQIRNINAPTLTCIQEF